MMEEEWEPQLAVLRAKEKDYVSVRLLARRKASLWEVKMAHRKEYMSE